MMRDLWERHFMLWEPLLCFLVAAALYVWEARFNGPRVLGDAIGDNRAAVYGTLASILGALLGFVITTVSIVIVFATARSLDRLRASNQYNTLWRVLVSTIRWLGFATAMCLVALVLDRPAKPMQLLMHLTFFAVAASGIRVWRTAWVLENIIAIVVKQTSKGQPAS